MVEPDGPQMEALVDVIQELSMAGSLAQIMKIVRRAARRLTGADGATFILRDGDLCFYADEDAIAPLWKGRRFPMSACISGWAMLNRAPAVIEDIYADDRIPHDAYRPTFVKSLAMVPIRTLDPVGAIGNYWATSHAATPGEVAVLQALADSTAVALENVRIATQLEVQVAAHGELHESNQRLNDTNRSLREFFAVAAHDLRGPLTALRASAELLHNGVSAEHTEQLLDIVLSQAAHMTRLTDDLMTLAVADAGQLQPRFELFELAPLLVRAASEVVGHEVEVHSAAGLTLHADPHHIHRVVANLVRNAAKYGADPIVVEATRDGTHARIAVIDHGPGVPPDFVDRLFERFTRAEGAGRDGAGLGLSIVDELARINGGRVGYVDRPGGGSCFTVVLPLAATTPARRRPRATVGQTTRGADRPGVDAEPDAFSRSRSSPVGGRP